MLFWRIGMTTVGIPGISEENRSEPKKDPSDTNNGETNIAARRTEAHRMRRGTGVGRTK
jgi:hypothetical protein